MRFERPIGAAADARELEYIASLHQTNDTDPETFIDGSIEAIDVKNFLLSRYGINVTEDEIRKSIFYDLAGGDSDDDCIDLTEVVAMLVIPYLVRVAVINENGNEPVDVCSSLVSKFEKEAFIALEELRKDTDESIIEDVLGIILSDVTGSSDPKPLTKELLREIFKEYEEDDLIDDDELLDEMIEIASGGDKNAVLDAAAFTRGLTSDIKLYNPLNETKFTTHYEDVFGMVTLQNVPEEEEADGIEDQKVEVGEKAEEARLVPRIYTFPQIDFLADTFRDKLQYLLVWVAIIMGFLTYFEPFSSYGIEVCQEGHRDQFRCQVGKSIVVWFAVMAVMIFIMAPANMILSLGNNVHRHSLLEICSGVLGIGVLIFFPALYHKIDTPVFKTVDVDGFVFIMPFMRRVNLFIGILLLIIQICNLVRFCIPDDQLKGSKFLTLILRGTGVRGEFGIKKASAFKVDKMIQNAYKLHACTSASTEGDAEENSSRTNALLNYNKEIEKRETSGGFLWAWKSYWSGELLDKEGIWTHTRLQTASVVQLALSLIVPLAFYSLANAITAEVFVQVNDPFSGEVPQNLHCGSYFDPKLCEFPKGPDGESIGIGICWGVSLANPTCLDNFVKLEGFAQNGFCYVLEEYGYSAMFGDECPELYAPFPSQVYTQTSFSVADDYCAAPVGVCTPTNDDATKGLCIIGMETLLPFQFLEKGTGCSNYTSSHEDFETLLIRQDEVENAVEEQTAEFVDEYFPKEWMVYRSIAFGALTASLAGIANALVCMPSQVFTTLKFRTGTVETLRDPRFTRYRSGLLQTTYLLGASIWGTFFMTAILFVVITVTVLLCLYEGTQTYIFTFLSLLIGVTTTLLVKVVASILLNNYNFDGYYRKNPVFANISNLCFECWHLTITSGYVIARFVKLTVIVILFLGRYDVPILADGVGEIGKIRLDNFPHVFKMDLLAIDAHRHPYIERLGMMYMMKLKHGAQFGKKAGSIWRLLFVFALMPWLRKYRIASNLESIDKKQNSEGAKQNLLKIMQEIVYG
mmetsp:Transcript_10121/g.14728  ORF Transcript_10121/g.14728 Transcript_10121/m.14728 type:complete len:1032 (-) Transcript_10121:116-3211(-)